MTKVSIIIPAYNQAEYLRDAINSALEQTYSDVEVIVVDDGSTDHTPAVTAEYAGRPNVKLIRQPNAGLSGARNRGFSEATGEYICFLDSDDYFSSEKVEKQAAILDTNPEFGFVYCDIVTVDLSGTPVAEQCTVARSDRILSGNIFQSLLQGGYFPPHTVMLRRTILDELGGFDLDCGGHADYEFWLRISAAGHTACFQTEALAYYRTHPDSMSKDGPHMRATRIMAFRKIAERYPDVLARGLNAVQQMNEDLYKANAWLQNAHQLLQRELFVMRNSRNADAESGYALFDHMGDITLIEGNPDQLAIWNATVGGRLDRALFLQSPAKIEVQVASNARGCFLTAISIHPDAWNQSGAGGCTFRVEVDHKITFSMTINPTRCEADRQWHDIRLDIPSLTEGTHCISLETKSADGRDDFRWALWRDPVFVEEEQFSATEPGVKE